MYAIQKSWMIKSVVVALITGTAILAAGNVIGGIFSVENNRDKTGTAEGCGNNKNPQVPYKSALAGSSSLKAERGGFSDRLF